MKRPKIASCGGYGADKVEAQLVYLMFSFGNFSSKYRLTYFNLIPTTLMIGIMVGDKGDPRKKVSNEAAIWGLEPLELPR